jgi:hypothetical protein
MQGIYSRNEALMRLINLGAFSLYRDSAAHWTALRHVPGAGPEQAATYLLDTPIEWGISEWQPLRPTELCACPTCVYNRHRLAISDAETESDENLEAAEVILDGLRTGQTNLDDLAASIGTTGGLLVCPICFEEPGDEDREGLCIDCATAMATVGIGARDDAAARRLNGRGYFNRAEGIRMTPRRAKQRSGMWSTFNTENGDRIEDLRPTLVAYMLIQDKGLWYPIQSPA